MDRQEAIYTGDIVMAMMRLAGVLRSQSAACLLPSGGDGQVCAFAKAVGSRENAAVVLGLAAGRIDQVLQENKIDVTWEHPWNLGSCDEGKVRR
jgi:hypothetical protein